MRERKKGTGTLVAGLVALLLVLAAAPALAEVNVSINVGPPAVVVHGPPEMIAIPQTMVYFAPGVRVGLFFYDGYWWTPNHGRWFRSRGYNGPWVHVGPRFVPRAVVRVPRDYRRRYGHGHRVPYRDLRRHYEHRERDRRANRGIWRRNDHRRPEVRRRNEMRRRPEVRRRNEMRRRPEVRRRNEMRRGPEVRRRNEVRRGPEVRRKNEVRRGPEVRRRNDNGRRNDDRNGHGKQEGR